EEAPEAVEDDRIVVEAAAAIVAAEAATIESEPEPETAATPAPGGPALATFGLTRTFGGIRAVDDVTISVAPGEILGIIGPNGAGKTTLFDLIAGFTPADGGRIELGGHEISGYPAHRRAMRGLGRSFQDA